MSKILLSMVAASALVGAALPAAAQDFGRDHRPNDRYEDRGDRYDRGGGYGGIDARQSAIDFRIERGIRTGQLTRREAWELKDQSREIARVEYRYRANGLNGWERADLDRRLDRLDYRVSMELSDRDGHGFGPRRGF